MKIEKLNENKIRVTINYQDLENNNIDVHSFMSNSIESQNMFLNILDEAERKVGFFTDDYKLSVEALALSNSTFIITVTKIETEFQKTPGVHTQRKNISKDISERLIYKFSNYNDLISLEKSLSNSDSELFDIFTNSYLLYEYKNFIFLILENLDNKIISKMLNLLGEFAVQIEDSEFIVEKIKESGKNGDGDSLEIN